MNVIAGRAPARCATFTGIAPSAFAGAVAGVATLLVVVVPHLFVQDTWLTLVSGREVVRHGLPTVDHLTVLAAGRSWVDQQWLAQVLFYGAATVVGLKAVALAQLLACVVAIAVLMRVAYVRGASAPVVAVTALVAIAAAPWAFQVRAQGLALPLFAAVLALLLADRGGRRAHTWIVFPLLCVWANVHGSVALGALLVTVYGIVTWKRGARSLAFVVLPVLTMFASPYASSLPGYYKLMLVNPPFAGLNSEWQRSTPAPLTAVFYALVALVLGALIARRRRFSRFDVALLAITGASAFLAVRSIVWFALACVAVLPPALSQRRTVRAAPSPLETAGVLASVVVLGLATVSFLGSHVDGGRSAALADAVARSAGTTGTVFADDEHADWLLWRIPSLRGRVAYDVRFELLRRPEIQRLSRYVHFDPRWREVASRFDVVVGDRTHVVRLSRARPLHVVFASDDGTVAAANTSATGTR